MQLPGSLAKGFNWPKYFDKGRIDPPSHAVEVGTSSSIAFLRSPRMSTPSRTSIRSVVFAQRGRVTDRHNDTHTTLLREHWSQYSASHAFDDAQNTMVAAILAHTIRHIGRCRLALATIPAPTRIVSRPAGLHYNVTNDVGGRGKFGRHFLR